MGDRPIFLTSGSQARLFPVLAETSREKRVASIFLAVMTQVPALSQEILSTVGLRTGKRTTIQAFTEVVLKEKADATCRPDGLIIVNTGRREWSALIEAKIGRNELLEDQVLRYVELARINKIDAVITISNQFVARADHSPVDITKSQLKKVSLFHWSWAGLATACEILAYRNNVVDHQQKYLLGQLNSFLAHPATGVERFTQMAPTWRDINQDVSNGVILSRTSKDVERAVASWLAEEKDLRLHMTSHIGREVLSIVPRKLQDDPNARLRAQIDSLVDTNVLDSTFRVPDCASDISLCADLARRTIAISMVVRAPADRKSTRARLNWLLRMLPVDDPRILIRAHWPGRSAPTAKELSVLRTDPDQIQTENPDLVPHSFEVMMIENTGRRFTGRKTFIEDIERIMPEFYDMVAANLKAWQAAPPKAIKLRDDGMSDPTEDQVAQDQESADLEMESDDSETITESANSDLESIVG